MSLSLNKIQLGIIGKPNSGKSTLFNCLLGREISPVGDEYGLTKNLFKDQFEYKNYKFVIVDTPGLRRRSKVFEKDEMKRNSEVLKLVNSVNVIILLIDSLESITKQDFRLADLSISRQKILFFIFNKIDKIDDQKKYKRQINNFLKNNYSKYKMINIGFISAMKAKGINTLLSKIIEQNQLVKINIKKINLNKYLSYLNKQSKYPKIKKIEIKAKYIVQLSDKIPTFKVFINTKNKAPEIFKKYFDNSFRKYFNLNGVPISYVFVSARNPYTN